jgi:hypothetical protein
MRRGQNGDRARIVGKLASAVPRELAAFRTVRNLDLQRPPSLRAGMPRSAPQMPDGALFGPTAALRVFGWLRSGYRHEVSESLDPRYDHSF